VARIIEECEGKIIIWLKKNVYIGWGNWKWWSSFSESC